MEIVALLPAHNEESILSTAISSLRSQTLKPTRIVVIADNCTDSTVSIAMSENVEIIVTEGNVDRKAGALNIALREILPSLGNEDAVLVMDADSTLVPTFLEIAVAQLLGWASNGKVIGAVSGLFYAAEEHNIIQTLQANEYHRYSREIIRRKDNRNNVLAGAGSLFSVGVLVDVVESRKSGMLPQGYVYCQKALTEDNELTMAVRTLGYECVSPRGCELYTDVPRTMSELVTQRLRWRAGAIENFRMYGITKITAWPLVKFGWTLLASLTFWIYLALLVAMVSSGTNPFKAHILWTSLFALYLLERFVSLTNRSWKAKVISLTLVADMAYDLIQQYATAKALYFASTGRRIEWGG